MSDKEYRLTYEVTCHQPPITREKIPDGHGACDAIVVCQLTEDEDRTLFKSSSVNGATGESVDHEVEFYVWAALAEALAKKLPSGSGRQELCALVAETVNSALDSVPKKEKAVP